jgi:hypothetical protein
LLGNGDGTFQSQVTYTVGSHPKSIAEGDFNGDGIPDLAVANVNSNTMSVLLGNGNGTFKTQVTYAVGTTPDAVAVADFNGDGDADVPVGKNGTATAFFSTFLPRPLPPPHQGSHSLGPAPTSSTLAIPETPTFPPAPPPRFRLRPRRSPPRSRSPPTQHPTATPGPQARRWPRAGDGVRGR